MKPIRLKDLKERVSFLLPFSQEDNEGGWHHDWREGPQICASIRPMRSGFSFHARNPGGAMAVPGGYVSLPIPALYRVIIRSAFEIPPTAKILWHLFPKPKSLLIAAGPTLIHKNQFLEIVGVEEHQDA